MEWFGEQKKTMLKQKIIQKINVQHIENNGESTQFILIWRFNSSLSYGPHYPKDFLKLS
jgi:hypothetical protein